MAPSARAGGAGALAGASTSGPDEAVWGARAVLGSALLIGGKTPLGGIALVGVEDGAIAFQNPP